MIRAEVWDRSGGVCFYCGCTLHPIRTFEVDHIVPRGCGRNDHLSNLVASCSSCNRRKGGKSIEAFRASPESSIPDNERSVEVVAEPTAPTLSVSEAAARLQVHPATLRKYADRGLIPMSMLPSGYRRFYDADVARFKRQMEGALDRIAQEDTDGNE